MAETSELLEILLQSALGRIIHPDKLAQVAPFARLKTWNPETIVFNEQEPATGFYVVKSGVVKLVRYRADGRELTVHFAEPPQTFAEAAIFLGRFPVTAITESECELVFIPKAVVMEHLASDPEFSKYLLRMMAAWLERLVAKMDTVVQNDASSRVIRFLLNEKSEQIADKGERVVLLHYKKADLAQMLNMNQATLSRTFKKLHDEGLIDVKGRTFILHDPKKLETLLLPPLD